MITPDLEYEKSHWSQQHVVVGIDEVGRGCLAGPLYVCGALFRPILHEGQQEEILKMGIRDSKLLSEKKREILFPVIKKTVSFFHLSKVSEQYINTEGIVKSLERGICEIINEVHKHCPDKHITFLIDGLPILHIPYNKDHSVEFIVKGDTKCLSIAAASILAKVSRDEHMKQLSKQFNSFNWDENKGYGTARHIQAIREYGVTPHHRTLFVRNILSD
jgi:ribonuclease HII